MRLVPTPPTNSMPDPVPMETSATLARLHAKAWGIATGLLFGMVIFAATIILVLKGGPDVGAHLGLLAVFFPGYSVTVAGSFIGFLYGFVLGYAFGRIVGTVYNRLVRPA